VQKTLTVGTPGSEIYSVLSFYTILIVPSMAFIAATSGEHSPCEGFSIGETVHFECLEFVTNRFGSLSLSTLGDGSGTIITGPARRETPLL
jgi:hypothetical protein